MNQREIKFRAWDKIQKVMFDPVGVMDLNTEGVMQFTGLKDKNSKEIYEGDIVKYDGGNLFVTEFKFGKWLFVNKKDDLKTGIAFDLIHDGVEMEVIGNIYEHSHLLNNNGV